MNAPKISDINIELLRWTKQVDVDLSLVCLIDFLKKYYHPELRPLDAFELLLHHFMNLMEIKEFELCNPTHLIKNVIMSPVRGSHNVASRNDQGEFNLNGTVFGPQPGFKCSIEQFYESMTREILIEYRLSCIGWCRDMLWPKDKESEKSE